MKHLALVLFTPTLVAAGPFAPAAGQPGSTAIPSDHPAFVMWASSVELDRGPVDITVPDGARAQYGSATSALGPADADSNPLPFDPNEDPATYPVVSLGDGGTATLGFPHPLADGEGPDFAVFENGFSDQFLELAFVEVSSDGIYFARFPATSLTAFDSQVSSFGILDPTDLHHFAGKYRAGYGTPFDLADLRDPKINPAAITHVRVVDAIGSITPSQGTRDHTGQPVNDPFPTPFPSGGFDLDAIGALHAAPVSYEDWAAWYLGDSAAPFDADPDRDGVPNRLEWSLWLDPRHPDRPFRLHRQQSAVQVRFRNHDSRRPGLIRLAGSSDLATWTEIARLGEVQWQATADGAVVTTIAGPLDSIQIDVTATPFQFFRLESEG